MPHASFTAVLCFELLALVLWLGGIEFIRRHPRPLYIGVYVGSSTLFGFDWAFNSKWFFQVRYSSHFLPLFRIHGEVQPIALCMTYAFYFGAPMLFALHWRDILDRRFGTLGWLVVFGVSALANPVFEIPLVHWLHLWTYYQSPGYLLGGVPWSNIWFSGLLFTACYGALRLLLRWLPTLSTGRGASADAIDHPDQLSKSAARETWWREAILGGGAIWASFYGVYCLQLIWYALTQPWIPSGNPS